MMFAAFRLEGVERLWLWALGLAMGGWVLYYAYRGIYQRTERRLTWALLGLRIAGLFALVVILTKPTWTRQNDIVDAGRVGIVLDDSLSMSLSAPPPTPSPAGGEGTRGGGTRYAAAQEALGKLRETLASHPGGRLEVDLFDIKGMPLTGQGPSSPKAERTDLVRAVGEAAARLRSKPLAGLVIISDGVDNTGRQDFRELADLPVPVFTLGFTAQAGPGGTDLAVTNVRAPERAMVHNEVKADVTVSCSGGKEVKARLVIKRGQDVLAAKDITVGGKEAEQQVSMAFTPKDVGTFVFTASLEAEGERLRANSSRHFPLRVDSEPIRILYIEGFLRFEFKFLKARLEDDPDVSLISMVRSVNPEHMESRAGKDMLTAERLKNIDVVILGDMEAGYLNAPEYKAVERWLDEKGHALLVLGGYHSFGTEGFRTTPLAQLLPVVFADKEPVQSEDPFSLELTEEGKRHPIFQVSGDRVKDAELWASAPALTGTCLVQRARPGADVLAVHPSLQVEGKPAVIVATQRVGSGYSMVLTADTTWRWTRLPRILGGPDTLYARFWSQTVRWLAGRTMDDQRPLLVASTDQPAYEVSKPVLVKVVKQPRPGDDLVSADVNVDMTGPDGKTVNVPVRSSSAQPDVFTGTFYPSAGGRYQMNATLNRGGQTIANQAAEFLVHGADLELADPRTSPGTLQAIAAATGGLYLEVTDADKVAQRIQGKMRRVARLQRSEMWDSPLLFTFFIAALATEWLIRRKNNMV